MMILAAILQPAAAAAQEGDIAAFQAGKTNTFSSRGHPKASGLNISFKLPPGWIPKEGNHPHIVVNFTNYERSATCSLLILNSHQALSKHDTLEAFSPESLKKTAPEGAIPTYSKRTTIDGLPAGELIYHSQQDLAGIAVAAYAVQFVTIYSPYFAQLTCSVTDIGNQTGASQRFASYLPLFHLIASSVVIHNQWNLR